MSRTVGDAIVERLIEWGVERIFGYPGDGINGLMGSMRRMQEKVRFLQARHEELAAFMACAHAKFTGRPGVCMATSGPGAIHLLNGLYDAKKDHTPVVAIVGQSATFAMGSNFQQEVDLISLFKDVASDYVHMIISPAGWRHQIDRAMRIARAERTVTCVIIPHDLQEKEAEDPPRKHGASFSGVGYAFPEIIPNRDQLARAAQILNEGERVAMLVGAGALGAGGEVVRTAERLGAGIAKALLGKAVVPDTHPLVTGAIGLLGTHPSDKMMRSCDTLLMVGTGFPYAEFLPKPGDARCVQIDVKARQLSVRFPADVALHGDAALTLRALLPMLEQKPLENDWTKRIKQGISEWWRVLEARAMNSADPINPQLVFWEASKRLPDNCIVSADSGSSACWFARDIVIREGMMASLSGGLATMCPGVPYALGAKFAYPDRVSVAFVGDGAMQMLGINGTISVAMYWKEWKDPRLVIAVLNNRDLNMVTWEQRVMAGDAKFEGSQNLMDFPYAKYAEEIGLAGIKVERPEDIGSAWDRAFAADRPCVLEFVTDPDVPMLPPHITLEQAKSYLSSMLKGDPDTGGMIRETIKDVAQTYLPHGSAKDGDARPVPPVTVTTGRRSATGARTEEGGANQ